MDTFLYLSSNTWIVSIAHFCERFIHMRRLKAGRWLSRSPQESRKRRHTYMNTAANNRQSATMSDRKPAMYRYIRPCEQGRVITVFSMLTSAAACRDAGRRLVHRPPLLALRGHFQSSNCANPWFTPTHNLHLNTLRDSTRVIKCGCMFYRRDAKKIRKKLIQMICSSKT